MTWTPTKTLRRVCDWPGKAIHEYRVKSDVDDILQLYDQASQAHCGEPAFEHRELYALPILLADFRNSPKPRRTLPLCIGDVVCNKNIHRFTATRTEHMQAGRRAGGAPLASLGLTAAPSGQQAGQEADARSPLPCVLPTPLSSALFHRRSSTPRLQACGRSCPFQSAYGESRTQRICPQANAVLPRNQERARAAPSEDDGRNPSDSPNQRLRLRLCTPSPATRSRTRARHSPGLEAGAEFSQRTRDRSTQRLDRAHESRFELRPLQCRAHDWQCRQQLASRSALESGYFGRQAVPASQGLSHPATTCGLPSNCSEAWPRRSPSRVLTTSPRQWLPRTTQSANARCRWSGHPR